MDARGRLIGESVDLHLVRIAVGATTNTRELSAVPPERQTRPWSAGVHVTTTLSGLHEPRIFGINAILTVLNAFTAELFMGTPGLGEKVNFAQSFGLYDQLYAYAVATGVFPSNGLRPAIIS